MKRKIVQHGSSSLTVSLPYKWAKQFNLKKGDELEVEEAGKSICIHTSAEQTKKEYTFHIKNEKLFLKRYITNLYKQGYDEIKLIFDCPVPNKQVIEKIDELLGFEVTDQGKNFVIIKNVAKVVEEEFDAMLRRLFIITLTIADDILKALKEKDYGSFREFYKLEKENNKLANFCQRILNKLGKGDISRTTTIYSMIDLLELIADSFGDLAEMLHKEKIRPSNELLSYFVRINLYFRDVYDVFYSMKTEKIHELKKIRLRLYEDHLLLFQELNKKELLVLQYLKQVLEYIHHIEVSLIRS